jgi:uncharacterized damage-inducible protein DinB
MSLPRQHRIPRPASDEYPPYFITYLEPLPGDDAAPLLVSQGEATVRRLGALPAARALHRYAPGKWSIQEVLLHVCDAERVFACRALRFGRGDSTPLPGFDEQAYARAAAADTRDWESLVGEFRAVRAATVALFEGFDQVALARSGTANGLLVTVRALAWIIAAHERHHREILRTRYGVDA